MAESIVDLVLRGKDDGATSTLERVSGQVGGLSGALTTAAGFTAGGLLTNAIGSVAGSVKSVASEMIGSNAAFEQYGVQFGVLLGSADLAQQRMEELSQFGASTPFELPGVVQADLILQGFGLHSQEAATEFGYSGEQIRTIAGDVASGTGANFEEMAGLIGRFSAGATGEAISRMQEMGITTRKELAEMGLEFSGSGQLLSPLPEAMQVVLGLMEEKYGGMMAAQSQTFTGMMSNLEDWKGNTLRVIGEPIFEILKDKLGDTLDVLSSPDVQAGVATFAESLANGIGIAVDWLNETGTPAMKEFVFFIRDHMDTILPVVKNLAIAFGTFSVLSTVAGWISGLIAVFGTLSTVITAAGPVIGVIVGVLGGPLTLAIGAIVAIVGGLTLAWKNNWGDIQGKTEAAVTWIKDLIGDLGRFITSINDTIGDIVTGIGRNIIQGIANGITAAARVVVDAVGGVIESALDSAKEFLGISSPSAVAAAQIGAPFAQGVAAGVGAEIDAASAEIQRNLNVMVQPLTVTAPRPQFGQANAAAPATTHVTHTHTYQVTINDTRAMTLFLDYLESIGNGAALEAI